MKTVVTITVILVGIDGCGGSVDLSHRQVLESIAECREYARELLVHDFVQSATCTETKVK